MKRKTVVEHPELAELRLLAIAVRDQHGRPLAVSIIHKAGKAATLADVATTDYPALKVALTEMLEDPITSAAKYQPEKIGGTAKFVPHWRLSAIEHYKERLREIGRLAAALDADPGHPLDTIRRFFEIDEIDKKIVLEAYHESPKQETQSG